MVEVDLALDEILSSVRVEELVDLILPLPFDVKLQDCSLHKLQNVAEVLGKEGCPQEIKYNALMLVNNVVEWKLEEVNNAINQQKLTEAVGNFVDGPHGKIAENIRKILTS